GTREAPRPKTICQAMSSELAATGEGLRQRAEHPRALSTLFSPRPTLSAFDTGCREAGAVIGDTILGHSPVLCVQFFTLQEPSAAFDVHSSVLPDVPVVVWNALAVRGPLTLAI